MKSVPVLKPLALAAVALALLVAVSLAGRPVPEVAGSEWGGVGTAVTKVGKEKIKGDADFALEFGPRGDLDAGRFTLTVGELVHPGTFEKDGKGRPTLTTDLEAVEKTVRAFLDEIITGLPEGATIDVEMKKIRAKAKPKTLKDGTEAVRVKLTLVYFAVVTVMGDQGRLRSKVKAKGICARTD